MRKVLFSLLLLLGTVGMRGQVVPGHSVSADLLGVKYGYEFAIGGNWSLITRAGLETTFFSVSSNSESTNIVWNFCPQISVEPRIYTSMERRQSLGRSTANNSSDFFAMPVQIYISNGALVGFAPEYGIRRELSAGSKWFYEVSGGIHVLTDFGTVMIRPRLQGKIGISF